MKDGEDLDLYPRRDPARIARGAARVLGILFGAAVSLYGVALYALRCFDTCPTDPAEDAVGQLLSGAVLAFGLVIAVASACVGTRWAGTGLAVVIGLGCFVAVAGGVTVALVPRIDAPGDHGSTAAFGVIALAVGGLVAAAAVALRRRAASS